MHKETNSPAAVSSAEYLYCQSNFELKHERQQASNRDILLRIIQGIFEGLKWKNWLIRAQNQFHFT